MLESFTWFKQSAYQWRGDGLIVYIDPWDADGLWLTYADQHAPPFRYDSVIREGDVNVWGDLEWAALAAPGHDMGAMVFYNPEHGILVSGETDVLVRFGKCCSPLPGDEIVGFITRGRGVTVHALECPKVLESDPQRRIDAQWVNGQGTPRAVKVEVTCVDRPGLLAAMSKAISSAGINITRAQVHTLGDRKAQNTFELMVGSLDELNRVMRSLGRVRGVMKVARVRT